MARFDNGIDYYTTGIAHVVVNFPENVTACCYCSFCYAEESLKRHKCRLTGEIIVNPYNLYRGANCPIVFEEGYDERTV